MTHSRFVPVTLLTALALAACGSADESSNSGEAAAPNAPTSTSAAESEAGTGVVDPTLEEPQGLDTVQQFLFDGMASSLQEAADLLDRGEDPTFACTSVLAYAEDEQAASLGAAAQKAEEQCGREIPLAWAALQLDTVEATGDVTESIGECASALVSLDLVEERFTDPRVSELRSRSDQLCA